VTGPGLRFQQRDSWRPRWQGIRGGDVSKTPLAHGLSPSIRYSRTARVFLPTATCLSVKPTVWSKLSSHYGQPGAAIERRSDSTTIGSWWSRWW